MITKQHIQNLIHLLTSHGLTNGAGSGTQQFCVQQAVNRVINEDLMSEYDDSPYKCVGDRITAFGITMNDYFGNSITKKQRAEMLKRFAIAEMGSNEIKEENFFRKLNQRLGIAQTTEQGVEFYLVHCPGGTKLERMTYLANMSADVLQEMETEGSKFLYLLDEPNKRKRAREAYKLGKKSYAVQMSERCPAVCPTRMTH